MLIVLLLLGVVVDLIVVEDRLTEGDIIKLSVVVNLESTVTLMSEEAYERVLHSLGDSINLMLIEG
jgi:hypothetical protein